MTLTKIIKEYVLGSTTSRHMRIYTSHLNAQFQEFYLPQDKQSYKDAKNTWGAYKLGTKVGPNLLFLAGITSTILTKDFEYLMLFSEGARFASHIFTKEYRELLQKDIEIMQTQNHYQ